MGCRRNDGIGMTRLKARGYASSGPGCAGRFRIPGARDGSERYFRFLTGAVRLNAPLRAQLGWARVGLIEDGDDECGVGFLAFPDADGRGGELNGDLGVGVGPLVDLAVHVGDGPIAEAGMEGSAAGG